ncbi:hypothetical protein RJ55_00447 [Drechmeria coniospora]|nr:hypothetical protein RJ55_00447 [Drechmeria coniospora]
MRQGGVRRRRHGDAANSWRGSVGQGKKTKEDWLGAPGEETVYPLPSGCRPPALGRALDRTIHEIAIVPSGHSRRARRTRETHNACVEPERRRPLGGSRNGQHFDEDAIASGSVDVSVV